MNLASCVLRKRSLSARIGWLCGVVVLFGSMMGAVGGWLSGPLGVSAACIAGLICLGGAVAALCISDLLNNRNMMAGLLLGMAIRMGLPLGLGLALQVHGGPLADAGLLYYLLVCYPATLTVETILSLPATAGQSADPQIS